MGSLGLGILHFCIWYFLFLYFVFFIFFRCCKCWEWLLEGGGVLGPGARAESFWPTHIPGHSAVYSINVHQIYGVLCLYTVFFFNSYSSPPCSILYQYSFHSAFLLTNYIYTLITSQIHIIQALFLKAAQLRLTHILMECVTHCTYILYSPVNTE